MVKILEYTDKIDYLVIAHTQSLKDRSTGRVDYNGDDVYTGLARKLGLIDKKGTAKSPEHPQVIDLSHIHHKLQSIATQTVKITTGHMNTNRISQWPW